MEKENPIPPAKQRILDASFNAFNQKGFLGVSMDSISKDLKISKKTIYKYFGSKEELLETSLVQLFGQVEGKLAMLPRQRASKNQLTGYYDILKSWKSTLSQHLRSELGSDLPYLHERIETFERQILLRHLIGYLKDLRTDEVIDYPSPSREFAAAFYQLMGSLITASDEQAHHFLTSLIRGMAPKKKKKGK
ncbi:MAG TPA: TetR/AcrR family transcriptional regulator [Bacteroidia bacterium]|nr:TetR/AcrR family transcriptional regulator [Bacteroidia bacterium]